MSNDISKRITVDVEVTSGGQQQINQYKAALDNLKSSISALSKPVTDFSKNISSLNKDIALLDAATEKSVAKMIALSKQLGDQQAKNNTASNKNLKTSLNEADKMREQALANALLNTNLGQLMLTEIDQYAKQKERLDGLFTQKGLDQQLYQKTAQQLLQQHFDKMLQITEDYTEHANEITARINDKINIDTTLSHPDIKSIKLQFPKIKPEKSFFASIGDDFKKLFFTVGAYYKKQSKETEKTAIDSAKTTTDKVAAINKTGLDQKLASSIDNAKKISDSVFSIMSASVNADRDYNVGVQEKLKNAELSNTSLTAAEKQAITSKYQTKENALKVKAFKQNQKASIAQAIINGAIAVTKAEADLGPIAGTIALGAIIAQTAAQVVTISKQQQPAMAQGGYFRSDGKGAILSGYSRTDNTNAYLRSGEAIVVSEAMQVPWARNLVSAINVGFGGRDFSVSNPGRGYAVGGIFTDGGDANRYYNQPVNDQKNLANTIAYQMINNFPPVYVDVKDINNQQNILAQTINRVNL
ncbi:MAG: hypothetical protein ABI113_00620 [Mucilaginibacter sp.]